MTMAFDAQLDIDDDALMVLFSNGDDQAAAVLAQRHAPRVLGHALRRLGDRAEAEDVTQEALLRLWKIAPNWRAGEAKVSTWLYRVTANLCTDRLRKGRHVSDDGLPEPADDAAGVEAQLIAGDRAAALHAALDRLPERQRRAIVLRHLEERSNPEIANELGTTVEAVESLLSRGRRALAGELAALAK